jgi:hypothetical protein
MKSAPKMACRKFSSENGVVYFLLVSAADRDDILCWRTQRHYYNRPKRWLESALRESGWQDKEDDQVPNECSFTSAKSKILNQTLGQNLSQNFQTKCI